MTNSIDRQNILDNLTAIETTAKLLVNAFVKKTNDNELSLNGIHRNELITQTTTFLSEAQKIILNLANTFNLTTDGLFDNKNFLNQQLLADNSQNNQNESINVKNSPSKKIYSISTVTLDDIIENRLTPKDLLPNYPLLHDPIQPNLVSFARIIRQKENLDDAFTKIYSKIFNHEERICCNYDGIHGKLPYPKHKRLLFDLIIKLAYQEHKKISDDHNERIHIYKQCEKQFSTETSLTKSRGINFDQINHINDEKQLICALFRLIIPSDDIKKILSSKQDISSQWNDNQMSIYNARPIHLLWIKQKWMEKYPVNDNNEIQKWSCCIDWAMESFLDTPKVRPSKRKTMDGSNEHKRVKTSLTLDEKFQEIDRTKFDVYEYSLKLLHLISDENNQTLPTFEQLQLLHTYIFRYYWTIDQDKTWSQIIDMFNDIFENDSNGNFRQTYFKNLFEINQDNQYDIERLLQIKFEDCK